MFWSTEQERALDKEKPQTKAHAVDMKVDSSMTPATWTSDNLGEGIRSLHAKGEGCDIELAVGEDVFPAHQVMLAAMSKAFRGFLQELRVSGQTVELSNDPMAGLLTIDVAPPPPAPVVDDSTNTVDNSSAPDPPADSGMTQSSPAVNPEAAGAPTAQTPAADSPTGQVAPAPLETPVVTETQVVATEAPVSSAEPTEQRLKLRVNNVTSSEAVTILLGYIYQVGTGSAWEFNPTSVEVDKDVLHLARHFKLDHLHENAARWLIEGLSTHNVVERLVICEEFQLGSLREKMLQQLAVLPDALSIVSNNASILKHPKIMQDLLMTVAMSNKQQKAPPPPPKKEEKTKEKEKEKEREKEKEKEKEAEKVVEKLEKPEKPEKEAEKKEKPGPPTKRAKKSGGA